MKLSRDLIAIKSQMIKLDRNVLDISLALMNDTNYFVNQKSIASHPKLSCFPPPDEWLSWMPLNFTKLSAWASTSIVNFSQSVWADKLNSIFVNIFSSLSRTAKPRWRYSNFMLMYAEWLKLKASLSWWILFIVWHSRRLIFYYASQRGIITDASFTDFGNFILLFRLCCLVTENSTTFPYLSCSFSPKEAWIEWYMPSDIFLISIEF